MGGTPGQDGTHPLGSRAHSACHAHDDHRGRERRCPRTPQGDQSANAISGWADATRNDLEDAQDSLDNEADTLADAIAQLTDAVRAITGAVTSGVKAVADVGRTDPELAAALRDSSTCQQLRAETTS